jgi:Fungal chitosanase of glycosyl hydrolase group 75
MSRIAWLWSEFSAIGENDDQQRLLATFGLLEFTRMSERQDPNIFEGVKRREPSGRFRWGWLCLLVVFIAGIGALFTPLPAKIKRGLKEIVSSKPEMVKVAADEEDIRRQIESRLRSEIEQTYDKQIESIKRAADKKIEDAKRSRDDPGPADFTQSSEGDIRQLHAGLPLKTEVKLDKGGLASKERITADSYLAEYTLKVRLPAPAQTMVDLELSNPKLGTMFPGLPPMVAQAEVSPWYSRLYENKTAHLRQDATALNELLSKHNLYDCETILNLRSPGGRKVFLLQADMDVVSDGSDGDRLATMPDEIVNSSNYQPFTSYGWPKKSPTPNPMIAGWEKRVTSGEKEIVDRTTSTERKKWLRDRISFLKKGISDLKSRSFLIAEYDPFIVIPVNILAATSDAFAPKIGDYALVVYGEKIVPAVVGDGGPNFKVGEASLRIAKELNTRASPYNRPVSDLKVTYLVFPGSREPERKPPDYAAWRGKCSALVQEIGGLGAGYQIIEWKDLLAPPPAPAPVPAPPPAGEIAPP